MSRIVAKNDFVAVREDRKLRLSILREANFIVNGTYVDSGVDEEPPPEVLDVAQKYYEWVTGND